MNKSIIRRPFTYTYNNVTLILIGVTVLFYLFNELNPLSRAFCSLNVLCITKGHYYWQFFTYMFTHGNLQHLLFNMLGLLFFGITIEKTLGSKEFILFYLLCGVLSGILSFLVYLLTASYNVFLMGASGAIYSVLFMYAVLFPRSKIYIWGILPVPAPLLVILYGGIEIFSHFFSNQSPIAHMTHLSGFLFAYVYIRIRVGLKPWKIWKNAYL
ncbi:MAG TPA: rhomboid family intramembrane serine protease [Treponemataceae bacterium]|nr:rhomboid family intramembrane serine protease [Treponemataceae bacterium]